MTKAIVTLKEEQIVADEATMAVVILKGGAGSGFFGHRGRQGLEGGSLPRGLSNASVLLKNNPEHQVLYNKLVNHSYFHTDKRKVLDDKLEASLQQQYEVLGFDPLEMIRRGRNKVYLQTERDFEKSRDYYGLSKGINIIGYISPPGSVYLECGRASPYYYNGKLSDYELNKSLAIDTITHEFGHVLYSTTFPGWYDDDAKPWKVAGRVANTEWNDGYEANKIGHHTDYSDKNEREGFAESYMSYVVTGGKSSNPEVMRTYEAVKKVIDAARLKYAK